MKTTKTEVNRRRTQLQAGRFTKAQVQRLAGVSERFVLFWYRGERTSRKVQAAHNTLYVASKSRNGGAAKNGDAA